MVFLSILQAIRIQDYQVRLARDPYNAPDTSVLAVIYVRDVYLHALAMKATRKEGHLF
jgi:hypothetical protein